MSSEGFPGVAFSVLVTRVLLVKRKARCLLVSRHADHVANEGESGAFAVVTMYKAARIQAPQFEHHVV